VQLEVAVHRRLVDDLFGQQQRPEQLGAPGQRRVRKAWAEARVPTVPSSMVPPQGDAGRFGECRAQHGARAAVLGDLQGEDARRIVGGQAEGVLDA
jgi:hypothetical protein